MITSRLKYVWFAVLISLVAPAVTAQSRRTAVNNSAGCVDVATLRQGKALRGLVVSGDGNANSPWLMAVERAAVQQDNPPLYQRATKSEVQKANQAYEDLKKRIEAELAQPDLNLGYKNFLDGELQRFVAAQAALQANQELKTRFMWVELTNKECSNMRRATPEGRRVAVWAWSEDLADVTRRDRGDLERELKEIDVDVQLRLPDLSKELPPRPESEESWLARLAWVRYTLVRGVDFQGARGVYLQAGQGRAVGAAEIGPLMQKMMNGSLESLIAELDPAAKAAKPNSNGNWFSSVTAQVESLGKKEFRITRLDEDPSGQAATVETAFVVKLPQRGWQIVWSSKQTRQAADVDAATEQQLANDPQIKAALSFVSALGVGAAAEIKKAIRYGAATMAAQKAADSEFLHMRDRMIDRLDGPPN